MSEYNICNSSIDNEELDCLLLILILHKWENNKILRIFSVNHDLNIMECYKFKTRHTNLLSHKKYSIKICRLFFDLDQFGILIINLLTPKAP